MTKDLVHPLLQQPIDALSVSPEFKDMSKANGFNTLQEILDEPLHELPLKAKSGYRMLRELLDVLQANGLEELAEDWENP